MAARVDPLGQAGWLSALAGVAVLACGPVYDPSGGSADSGDVVSLDPEYFTDAEWEQLLTHAMPAEAPDDPSNDEDSSDPAALLGQKLFFDEGYSASRTEVSEKKNMSCAEADCHDPTEWFQAVTTQAQNEAAPFRNAPTLVNTAFYTWYAWDGAHDSLWSQSLFPPEGPMHSDRVSVVKRMLQAYPTEYEDAFGPPELTLDDMVSLGPATPIDPPGPDDPYAATEAWEALLPETQTKINHAYANFGKALAAYQRRLVSRNSDFDRYLEGETTAIDESAKRGLRLFEFTLPCGECHAGPTFTDNGFHNIGTGRDIDGQRGRSEGVEEWLEDDFTVLSDYSARVPEDFVEPVASPDDLGRFRTKHLRQVAETGRYMHDGSLADLPGVLAHYADAAKSSAFLGDLDPLVVEISRVGLPSEDRDDLIAFLETLTGDPIPDELIGAPP